MEHSIVVLQFSQRYIVLAIVCLLSLLSCGGNDSETDEAICEQTTQFFLNPDNLTFISPEAGDGIFSLCTRDVPEDIDGFYDLEFSKVCLAFNSIKKTTSALESFCFKDDEFIDLEEYHYQFLGLTINQEEYIYINAFILPDIDTTGTYINWKNELIDTCGGGRNNWGALLNLSSEELSHIDINQSSEKAIIFYQKRFPLSFCTRCLGFDIDDYFKITAQEVCSLEEHFEQIKEEVATTCYFVGEKISPSYKHVYQYIGIIVDSRKKIYVNGLVPLIESDYNIHNDIISVCDGGKYAWGIVFDIESKQFSDLQFNGVR